MQSCGECFCSLVLFVLWCGSWGSFFGVWFVVFWCCYVDGFRCRIWDLVTIFCNHRWRNEWELCCLLCLCFWYCCNVRWFFLLRWACAGLVLFSWCCFLNFRVIISGFGGGSLLIWYCVVDLVLCFPIVTLSCWCGEFVVSFCFSSRFSDWFCCCISFVVVVVVCCCCCCCCCCCWFLLSESHWLSLLVFSLFWVG